jgi:hypothetical protein
MMISERCGKTSNGEKIFWVVTPSEVNNGKVKTIVASQFFAIVMIASAHFNCS